MSRPIRLFWWNEIKLQGKSKENYGDLLGKYIVEKISNRKVIWTKPSSLISQILPFPIYVTIGSILTNVNKKCVVWGSGIISKDYEIRRAKFLAVRGPQTRKYLSESGHDVPEIYGDPALLLPRYYNPKVKKECKIGIIPHYNDYQKVKKWFNDDTSVLLIDLMTNDIEETTRQILKCERIVSSSLHGIIVAHAYNIPAVWQKFSNNVFGDDIKYQDYFESVKMPPYKSEVIDDNLNLETLEKIFKGKELLPNKNVINDLCNGLMRVCPFNN